MNELREILRKLTMMLDDPHPWLPTWRLLLSRLLCEAALFCGHGDVIDAARKALDESNRLEGR